MKMRNLLLLTLALALVGAAGAFGVVSHREAKVAAYRELRLVAAQRVQQVVHGREKLIHDAEELLTYRALVERLAQVITEGSGENADALEARFERFCSFHGCSGVSLLAPSGDILWTNSDTPAILHPEVAKALTKASREERITLSEMYVDVQAGAPRIAVLAPIAGADEAGVLAGVVVLLEVDPQVTLFPVLTPWTDDGTSEDCGIIRRDNDAVLFVSHTLLRPDVAMKLRVPLSNQAVPVVRAILGQGDHFEGPDYRNIEVFSVVLPVPGSDWFVFAEIDQHEALHLWRVQSLLVSLSLVGAMLAILLGGISLWFRDRERNQQALQSTQTALKESNDRLEQIARHARTFNWEVDADGRYTYIGEDIQPLLGYEVSEVVGRMYFYDLHPPEGREAFKKAVLEQMRQQCVFNNLENAVLCRDQRILWVLSNGVPMLDGSGNLIGYRGSDRDISELKAAQDALRESEERHRVILEGSTQGVLLAEFDTMQFAYANPAVCRMLGYTEQELLQLRTVDIHPPEDEEANQVHFRSMLNNHTHVVRDIRCLRKDGSIFLADISAHTVHLNGKLHLAGFFTDLTQRKLLEARLFHTQTLAHLGSWELDLKRGAFSCTPEIYGIFEVDPVALGTSYDAFLALIHPDDLAALDATFAKSIATATAYKLAHRLRFPDGRIKWVEQHGEFEFDAQGFPWRANGTVQDISDRVQAEDLIQLQSAALQATANAIVISDRNGKIEWCNPAFLAMSGYSMEACIGSSIPELQRSYTHEPAFYAAMYETIFSGQVWSGEIVNKRADGTLYTEFMTVTPIFDSGGAFAHYVAIKEDVSARKALEAEYQQSQKMESIGKLAGGVAHDFNNLICVMSGYAEMVLEELEPGSDLASQVQQIQHAAQRAASLTRQLLAFSRKQVLTPTVLNINGHLLESEKMLRRLISEDIALVLTLGKDVGEVLVDPGQLEQVILNLAVNARDAMPHGGTFTVETGVAVLSARDVIDEEPVPPGRYVSLTVRDTGVGIPPETIKRVFEPFFTTKEMGKGTGLGLSTVYGIIRQSGGFIRVESHPGLGTTFRIYLPQIDESASEGAKDAASNMDLRGTETILLVEDDESLRQMMERALRAAGFKVLCAGHGVEAMEIFDRDAESIDLMVTDVIMPEMSGPQLAASIEARAPGMRVLFISGYTDDALSHHGVLNSGIHLLLKPFSSAVLINKIREMLDAGEQSVLEFVTPWSGQP